MNNQFKETKTMFENTIPVNFPISYEVWISLKDDIKAAALYVNFYDQITLAWQKAKSDFTSDEDGVSTLMQYLIKNVPIIVNDEKKYKPSYISLFEAAESLNRLKINQEVLKLRYKQNESELMKKSTARTVTQKRDEAAIQMIDDKLLMLAYGSVISRVESEISLSRELIMGAKKIWDARRKTDSVMPVGEVNTSDIQLPDYKKLYIHGSETI